MSLVLSMDMLDEVLRVPVEDRDIHWAHCICSASRYLHIEVWSSRCETGYAKKKVLPIFTKTCNVLNAMLESGDLNTPTRKAIEITKRNLEYRIRNLRENYLKGRPSTCKPRKRSCHSSGQISKKRNTEDRIYIVDEYYEGDKMKFGDIRVSGGNVNFVEKIEKIEYDQRSGVTKEQFDELKASIASLTEENRDLLNEKIAELAKADTEEKKESAAKKIIHFLIKKGVDVAKDVTVEFIKICLWP